MVSNLNPVSTRLTALRREMAGADLPALLVARPENRRYFSSFLATDSQLDESSGCLLVTPRRQYLLTDFRYQGQAEQEARDYEVLIHQGGLAGLMGRLLKRHRIKRVGFEEEYLTVRQLRLLREESPDVEWVPTFGLVERPRAIKDPGELRLMTKALRLTERALDRTFEYLEPGRTELEIARFLDQTMIDLGASGPAFETIVASGPNGAMPHAQPSRRRIRAEEPIIFDCGACLDGYNSDISRTVILGQPPEWCRRIYSVVLEAQSRAIAALHPGLMTNQADSVAREVIEAAGFGPNFGHSLGHGIGLAVHESPSLSRRNPLPLTSGMVVTVEPGIYLPGRGGVRLEQMVAITDNGAKVLNRDRALAPGPSWSE